MKPQHNGKEQTSIGLSTVLHFGEGSGRFGDDIHLPVDSRIIFGRMETVFNWETGGVYAIMNDGLVGRLWLTKSRGPLFIAVGADGPVLKNRYSSAPTIEYPGDRVVAVVSDQGQLVAWGLKDFWDRALDKRRELLSQPAESSKPIQVKSFADLPEHISSTWTSAEKSASLPDATPRAGEIDWRKELIADLMISALK